MKKAIFKLIDPIGNGRASWSMGNDNDCQIRKNRNAKVLLGGIICSNKGANRFLTDAKPGLTLTKSKKAPTRQL